MSAQNRRRIGGTQKIMLEALKELYSDKTTTKHWFTVTEIMDKVGTLTLGQAAGALVGLRKRGLVTFRKQPGRTEPYQYQPLAPAAPINNKVYTGQH